eukprot:1158430-Pelagomonas_calceolata.AAC.2
MQLPGCPATTLPCTALLEAKSYRSNLRPSAGILLVHMQLAECPATAPLSGCSHAQLRGLHTLGHIRQEHFRNR